MVSSKKYFFEKNILRKFLFFFEFYNFFLLNYIKETSEKLNYEKPSNKKQQK